MKTAYIKTFGCQMNVHDSEIISGILKDCGYVITHNEKDASLIVLNTCAVREHAEDKVYSLLGAIKKRSEKLERQINVIVCGCVAQNKKNEITKRFPYVLGVVGTKDIEEIKKIILKVGDAGMRPVKKAIISTDGQHFYEPGASKIIRDNKYKAWVSIIKGCENFCSYCIVPYVRGKELSRGKNDILKEIKMLADDGVKEICLLGQNVNSYCDGNYNFVDLVHDIDKLNIINRVKFVTSHPKDISLDLLYAMRDLKSLCEFLHFPCQSGSDRVLELMNRGYTKDKYIDLVEKAREIVPDICIGTDIICGFPSETEKDFYDTYDLCAKIKFDMAFIFKYSKRQGTKAAEFKDCVPEDIIKHRHAILLDLQNKHSLESNLRFVGKTVEVLVEEKESGRTRQNKIVVFKGSSNDIGKVLEFKINSATAHTLYGKK